MANAVKEAWKAGRAVVNGWLAIPNAFSAEMYSKCGWDSVTVDMQHGVQDYLSCVACFQGIQPSGAVPMVRVPWNEPGIIGKVLDAGAMGVICPMVNTEAEARALVQYCKYPPAGTRSNGPIRAGAYGSAGAYQKTANDEILVIPMIETRTAIENIGKILDVPGIDGIYIGPSDLSFSLGKEPKLDVEDPEILAIYDMLLAETGRRGIAAGLHNGTPAYAKRMIEKGFKLVTIANEVGLMVQAATAAVKAARGG
ncbi:2,4-dihydroxyhept-2-ene-1,7-dioic acid aldolase [Roseomonas alkaliterrae]|uniref:4-hydroxy-2-oxoheptanedioate aldolase n=1 Tax=Neoroseomonas alkaliterrae TaxID=1452450 RepID=A0A840XVP7_9PROT|nr:aldolase/citrate lyase family protein [Neoroseomonas alkaliterrae]MBB5690709.1 4-hydroxy-2-oxoheptanedioate aldolase [Neoroseomonas alkaliterrae]MBR0675417.1 2,4-dihydroxyhept-2-ene-1,7-dioic acid aldolase [Neoroseomonas alkaliterrae]